MATWTAPQCPFVIQYSLQVMNDIRLAALSGRFATPRGGMEVGGILFGKPERDRIIVSGQMPIDCEHVFGPMFQLSEKDRVRMAGLLSRPCSGGTTIVGWYRSLSRGSISLSETDLELYRRYFPEHWSVALVLTPSLYSTSAGFFFYERDGSIHATSSYREWELEQTSSAESEVGREAPKLELFESPLVSRERPQPRIAVPVPRPPAAPPTTGREQLALMSRAQSIASAIAALKFRRAGPWLLNLRMAIRIRKPVMAGAIVLIAALLFVWWNQSSAPLSTRTSQVAIRPKQKTSVPTPAHEAQVRAPSPAPAIPPVKPAQTQTDSRNRNPPLPGEKSPQPNKKKSSSIGAFDPLD